MGYETLASEAPSRRAARSGGQPVQALEAGDDGTVVLERTPFYAESGGQVGDTGELRQAPRAFAVSDTQKLGSAHSAHQASS